MTARILILEDDDALRELLATVLEDEGFKVEAAAGGEDAVEAALQETPDLVVLDVRMQGLDGLSALALMRSHLEEAAVLVITGYASEADSVRALRLGVSDYLHKPFELSLFLGKARDLLRETARRRLRRKCEQRLRYLARWGTHELTLAAEGALVPQGAATITAKAADASRRAALLCGLDNTEAEEIGIGASLLSLRHILGSPLSCSQDAPDSIRSIFQAVPHCQEPPGQDLPAQIAGFAIKYALQGEMPPYGELPRNFPEEQMDKLIGASFDIENNPPSALLYLGCALKNAGRAEDARQAFLRAFAGKDLRQRAKAALYLAEMSLDGRAAECEDYLKAAIDAAFMAGPAELGKTSLSCGIIMLKAQKPADNYLLKARDILAKLTLEPDLTRCLLALKAAGLQSQGQNAQSQAAGSPNPGDTASDATNTASLLNVLLKPQHEPQMLEDACWIAPYLGKVASEISKADIDCPPFFQSARQTAALISRNLPSGKAAALIPAHLQDWIAKNSATATPALAGPCGTAGTPASTSTDGTCRTACATADISKYTDSKPNIVFSKTSDYNASALNLPLLEIRTFGAFETKIGSEPIPGKAWHTAKAKYLLIYLLTGRYAKTEEHLAELFWPGNQEKSKQSLYSALWSLRKLLRTYYPSLDEHIIRSGIGISITDKIPVWLDLLEAEKACKGEPSISGLRLVLDICQGQFLSECDMDWAQSIRANSEKWQHQALTGLCSLYRSKSLYPEALEYALRLRSRDPLDPEAAGAVMELRLAMHRPDKAIRCYERFAYDLKNELNAEPPIELMRLYHAAKGEYDTVRATRLA